MGQFSVSGNKVYKPLLKVGQISGLNPIDVLQKLLSGSAAAVSRFFDEFDKLSRTEWFDSAEAIEGYFADEANFERLTGREFEKLNIMFSVILLKEFKLEFDAAILDAIKSFQRASPGVVEDAANFAFAIFPPLESEIVRTSVTLPENYTELTERTASSFAPSRRRRVVDLVENPRRSAIRRVIMGSHGQTLSKVLNTQSISLGDLRLALTDSFGHDAAFRRA